MGELLALCVSSVSEGRPKEGLMEGSISSSLGPVLHPIFSCIAALIGFEFSTLRHFCRRAPPVPGKDTGFMSPLHDAIIE